MRASFAEQFIMTLPEVLVDSVKDCLNMFERENKMDQTDQLALETIRVYLLSQPSSGILMRDDIVMILKSHYHYFFRRFWSTLPKQLTQLFQRPQFGESALKRGDSERLKPSIREYKLTASLDKVLQHNQKLSQQLKKSKASLIEAWNKNEILSEKLHRAQAEIHYLRHQSYDVQKPLLSPVRDLSRMAVLPENNGVSLSVRDSWTDLYATPSSSPSFFKTSPLKFSPSSPMPQAIPFAREVK